SASRDCWSARPFRSPSSSSWVPASACPSPTLAASAKAYPRRPEDRMQRYYADRAPEYDSIYAKPERQADLRAIEAWLAATLRGCTVLEIACGTGHWTQFIAPVAAGVVALDAAPETIRIAESRVPP